MPSAKNIAIVSRLQQQLQQAKAVVLANYRGLTVKDMQTLRAQIRAAGGNLTVAKNTLIKIALKNEGLAPALQGPTALILALEQATTPIKTLIDFAHNHALNLPTLKAGLLDDKILTAEEIKSLATLPSRHQLMSQLIHTLQAHPSALVTVLPAPLRQLVYVLTTIKSAKEVN